MSNNAIALYNNLLATANGQPEGGEFVIDDDTATRWFPADTDALEFTALTSTKVTHVGFAAHNLGTTGNSILVEYYDGSSWITLITLSSSDDQAKLIDVGTVVATGIRLTAQGSGINIGVVYVGEAFEFERRFYQGHKPIRFGDQNSRFVTRTAGGQYAGNQVRRRSKSTTVRLSNLTPQFVRTKLEPFRQHYNNGGKFFFSWRPDTFPDEAVFARGDGVMSPSNTGPAALMGVEFAVVAYVQTYRPDMISPVTPDPDPGPVLWTPEQISPPLWVDASDSSTITLTGSDVDSISNKGTLGGEFVSSVKPLIGSINGVQSLEFVAGDRMDGSAELKSVARNVPAVSAFSIVNADSGGSYRTVIGISVPGGSGMRASLFARSSTYYLEGRREDASGFSSLQESASPGDIFSGIYDYQGAEMYVGVNAEYTPRGGFETPGNSSDTDSEYVTMGTDGFGSFELGGQIGEIVVVAEVLAESDRQKLEGYLAWKWGKESLLPAAHPYKSEAPTV